MAYGNNNAFVSLFNQTGKVVLDATTFGNDPIFGTSKLVYCKPVVDGADAVTFTAALAKIKRHITGDAVLDAAQINLQAGLLAASMFTLVDSEATLAEALAVVEAYEKKEGTFFIGAKTKGGFPNKPGALDGLELARAMFTLQQGIHDQAFTPAAFAKHRALLGGITTRSTSGTASRPGVMPSWQRWSRSFRGRRCAASSSRTAPRPASGRPPVGLQRMLRMYFVQHGFNLGDQACEDALLDSLSLHRFVGIDLGRERVPDATTLLEFRRLLEKHSLGEALFAKVGAVLQTHGMKVGTGTIVDATLIDAPS